MAEHFKESHIEEATLQWFDELGHGALSRSRLPDGMW